jgi:hypothetical protein
MADNSNNLSNIVNDTKGIEEINGLIRKNKEEFSIASFLCTDKYAVAHS